MNLFNILVKKNNRTKQVISQKINAEVSNVEFPYNEEIAILRKTMKKLVELHPEIDFSEFNNYFDKVEQVKTQVKDEFND